MTGAVAREMGILTRRPVTTARQGNLVKQAGRQQATSPAVWLGRRCNCSMRRLMFFTWSRRKIEMVRLARAAITRGRAPLCTPLVSSRSAASRS